MMIIALLVGLFGLFISVCHHSFEAYKSTDLKKVSSILPPTKPSSRNELNTTAEAKKDKHYCCWETGWGWSYTYYTNTIAMRDKLKSRPSTDTIHISAKECFQIGCISDNLPEEVVICNDNLYPIEPNANYISNYVTDIIDKCRFYYAPLFHWVVCGQKFDTDTDNFNVIVKVVREHCVAK